MFRNCKIKKVNATNFSLRIFKQVLKILPKCLSKTCAQFIFLLSWKENAINHECKFLYLFLCLHTGIDDEGESEREYFVHSALKNLSRDRER